MKAAKITLYDLSTFPVAGLIETRRYSRPTFDESGQNNLSTFPVAGLIETRRYFFLLPTSMRVVLIIFNKTCFYRIISYIFDYFFIFISRTRPVIKPFPLPFYWIILGLIIKFCFGPAFKIPDYFCQFNSIILKKQMDMVRHNNILNYPPFAGFMPMPDSIFNYTLIWFFSKISFSAGIKKFFQHCKYYFLSFRLGNIRSAPQFFRQLLKPSYTAWRNSTCLPDRNKIQPFSYFPMRKTFSIESCGFRFSFHFF